VEVIVLVMTMMMMMMMMMAAVWMKKKLTTSMSFSLRCYFISRVCTTITANIPVHLFTNHVLVLPTAVRPTAETAQQLKAKLFVNDTQTESYSKRKWSISCEVTTNMTHISTVNR